MLCAGFHLLSRPSVCGSSSAHDTTFPHISLTRLFPSCCRRSSASSTAASDLRPSRWFGEWSAGCPPLLSPCAASPPRTPGCSTLFAGVCPAPRPPWDEWDRTSCPRSRRGGCGAGSVLQQGWGQRSLTPPGSPPQVYASPQPAARRGDGVGPAADGGRELHGVHPVSSGEEDRGRFRRPAQPPRAAAGPAPSTAVQELPSVSVIPRRLR